MNYTEYIQQLVVRSKENKIKWNRWEEWFYENYLKWNWRVRKQVVLWNRICDFVIHKKWIRIEVDWKHHFKKWYKSYDKKWDRILFNRYGFITLRVKDYSDIDAKSAIDFIKSVSWDFNKRLVFIKSHIRNNNICNLDYSDMSSDEIITIDYYKSLYPELIKKTRIKKEKKMKEEVNANIKIKKVNVNRDHFSSAWVNLLYKSFKN